MGEGFQKVCRRNAGLVVAVSGKRKQKGKTQAAAAIRLSTARTFVNEGVGRGGQ